MIKGTVNQLIRYPVKSFGGEAVQSTQLMNYGMYGDRSHVLLDENLHGKFLTITQFKQMARYKAFFTGPEAEESFPPVEVVDPSGTHYRWGDPDLTKHIEKEASTRVSSYSYSPEFVPSGAIEEESILLITDASLMKMEELWGNGFLNAARFRPNIILSLNNKIPFAEESWTGRTLQIGGEAELLIKRPCERCMIINVNPEDGRLNPSLLKTVLQRRKNVFGMYCSVVKTGVIKEGDAAVIKEV